MPQAEKFSAGDWVLDRTDTESHAGIAKLFITMPKSLNAQGRSKACVVLKSNFRRVQNVCVRRGQLVVKYIVSDASGNGLTNEVNTQAEKLLRLLDSEVTPRKPSGKKLLTPTKGR